MWSRAELKNEVEIRLRGYLSRDKTGIRHELLKVFLRTRTLTISETYALLREKFTVSYQAIASMVGTIASRIGIFHVIKSKDNATSVYQLKEQYTDIVGKLVSAV